MGDQRFDQLGRVLRRIGQDVEHAGRQAGIAQAFGDQAVGARANFGGLQDHGVAAGERQRHRAHAEDHRRVPRRHAQHDAGRLAHRHGDAARLVGGDDFARDLRGHRRRLAQHAGGEMHVEAGPAGGGAGLGRHQLGELLCLRSEDVGGFQEDRAARVRAGGRPGRKGGGRGVGGALGVGDLGCGSAAGDIAGDRVEAVEGGAVGGGDVLVFEQEGDFVHGVSSFFRDLRARRRDRRAGSRAWS